MKRINNVRKIQLIGILDEVAKPHVKNTLFSSSVCNIVVATKVSVGFL